MFYGWPEARGHNWVGAQLGGGVMVRYMSGGCFGTTLPLLQRNFAGKHPGRCYIDGLKLMMPCDDSIGSIHTVEATFFRLWLALRDGQQILGGL